MPMKIIQDALLAVGGHENKFCKVYSLESNEGVISSAASSPILMKKKTYNEVVLHDLTELQRR